MSGTFVRGETLPTDVSVTFPEGFTLAQIAARLEAKGIVGAAAFTAAAQADRFRGEFDELQNTPRGASLEGYLFPDTYRLKRGTLPEDLIRRMLHRFADQYTEARSRAAGDKGGGPVPPAALSTHVVVTMASIIEREVTSAEDRRLVSGILWKRLGSWIGLDADATIRYVLGNWDRPLTVQDLRVDSPYNTRRHRGLPPGPIGSPGLDSLAAALAPTASDFFYYLSAPSGETIFSATLDEHNAAKAKYLR
jgi:UPF0755 protein